MPTNLPDPQKRKTSERHNTFLTVFLGVLRIALILAIAMIIWSFFADGWGDSRKRVPNRGPWAGVPYFFGVLPVIGDNTSSVARRAALFILRPSSTTPSPLHSGQIFSVIFVPSLVSPPRDQSALRPI
jgi:hypothetical protein